MGISLHGFISSPQLTMVVGSFLSCMLKLDRVDPPRLRTIEYSGTTFVKKTVPTGKAAVFPKMNGTPGDGRLTSGSPLRHPASGHVLSSSALWGSSPHWMILVVPI